MLMGLWLAWVAWGQSPTPTLDYRVGVGDKLAVSVFGEPDLSKEHKVTSICSVEVALLGPVPVCGQTPSQIAEDLKRRLGDGYLVNPQVSVSVSEYGSQKAEVKGAVREPGLHVLEGPTTLSELITMAGGPISASVIRVQVATSVGVQEYDLDQLDAGSNPVWVEPGSTVILLPPLTVQVFGEVKTPGAVDYRPGLTVTEALGLAGGPSELAGLGRAYVVRAAGGVRERVHIRKIQLGMLPDLVLLPDDRLVVRRSIF
jgi:polysaccharide export outer membrane protein